MHVSTIKTKEVHDRIRARKTSVFLFSFATHVCSLSLECMSHLHTFSFSCFPFFMLHCVHIHTCLKAPYPPSMLTYANPSHCPYEKQELSKDSDATAATDRPWKSHSGPGIV